VRIILVFSADEERMLEVSVNPAELIEVKVSEVLQLGEPELFVTKTELFAVARPVIVFADEEYKSWFTLVVAG
jgi:hypothetical protein